MTSPESPGMVKRRLPTSRVKTTPAEFIGLSVSKAMGRKDAIMATQSIFRFYIWHAVLPLPQPNCRLRKIGYRTSMYNRGVPCEPFRLYLTASRENNCRSIWLVSWHLSKTNLLGPLHLEYSLSLGSTRQYH